MKKQYHFLAGFPRSGNTLLSSILNQNKQIYSSPLSPILKMLWDFEQSTFNNQNQNILRLNDITPAINVGTNIIKNYYSEITKPIIIDREKCWGNAANLKLIKKYIVTNPKIIFTIRPIIEILTSFINIMPEIIDQEMETSGWWYKDYLSKNDNRCEYLMRPQGPIDFTIIAINEIIKHENKDIFCIINYDDIVYSPQKTMDKIYNFLELPRYNHNFNKIIKLEKDNDEKSGTPYNIHEIRPQLNKISKNPREVLSEYIINKYSNIGWRV
jgi:sulfotransferase